MSDCICIGESVSITVSNNTATRPAAVVIIKSSNVIPEVPAEKAEFKKTKIERRRLDLSGFSIIGSAPSIG